MEIALDFPLEMRQNLVPSPKEPNFVASTILWK